MDILPLITIIEDLNRKLSPTARYQRLIAAITQAIPCDAIALLKLDGEELVPMAVIGLKREALARRFTIDQHPRLQEILQSPHITRFDANSPLPDPYDGLVANSGPQLHVHDCMGSAIMINGKPWGVLTLDALEANSFDDLNPIATRAFIAAIAATIKTSGHIDALQAKAAHSQQVAQRLLEQQYSSTIIGHSDAIKALLTEIDTVAPTDLSVLITGETGVGKELVAHSIHRESTRANQPMVQINCAALAENIVESELFGHLKGAFTGATQDRSGRFELADGGSLFLDEVGELPLAVQAKLLRALQNGEIQRVGSDHAISVDVRIIAATNRDLKQEVKAGRFRADLYHRLSVYPLPVPPLRERQGDSDLLAGFFLEKNQQQLGVARLRLSSNASAQLAAYDWPGNVRELEHVLSRAALKAIREQGRDSAIISIDQKHLGLTLEAELAARSGSLMDDDSSNTPIGNDALNTTHTPSDSFRGTGFRADSFRENVDRYQRQLINEQLQRQQGNIAATARALKLDRSNLLRTMARLKISAKQSG